MLVIENQKIFSIFKEAIENLSTCIGKVGICLLIEVSVM